MSEPSWMESWRRLAVERGYREAGAGWLSPSGYRVSSAFMRALVSAEEVTVPGDEPALAEEKPLGGA